MNYESKFKGLIEMCETAKKNGDDTVMIHHPGVLGDDYAEIVESLNRISDAELRVLIVPRSERHRPGN